MKGIGKPIYFLEEPKCYVYFVQMDKIGPIKIGYAKDVKRRLSQLQSASPYLLNLLGCYKAELDHEKEWHNAFYDIKLEGEWYLPHPFLLKEIELNLSQPLDRKDETQSL